MGAAANRRACNSANRAIYRSREVAQAHQKPPAFDRGPDGRRLADPRPCVACGTVFAPSLRYVARGGGNTCSAKCRGIYGTRAKVAAASVLISKNGVRIFGHTKEVPCEHCGVLFVVRAAHIREGKGRFCSRHCAQKARPKKLPYRERHPDRVAARYALKHAVEDGRVVKPSKCSRCGGCEKRIEGHHDDYSKPLEVEWLCTTCHKAHHKELRAA